MHSFCEAILRLSETTMHVFASCVDGGLCFSKCVCVCVNPASNMQVQINLSIFRSSDFRKLWFQCIVLNVDNRFTLITTWYSRGARPSVTTLPNEAMSLKGKQLGTLSCVPAEFWTVDFWSCWWFCFHWINPANVTDIFDSVLHRWLRIPQGMDKTISVQIQLKIISSVFGVQLTDLWAPSTGYVRVLSWSPATPVYRGLLGRSSLYSF